MRIKKYRRIYHFSIIRIELLIFLILLYFSFKYLIFPIQSKKSQLRISNQSTIYIDIYNLFFLKKKTA